MSRYLDAVRQQRHRPPTELTSKQVLIIVGLVSMLGAAAYWWGIFGVLTDDLSMRIAFTAILTLAPPALVAFLIPWSPAGMLLQKINARTWGYVVVMACASYLVYYSLEVQYSWWAAQPVTVDTGLVWQQVIIGLIGSIIIPALLFAPVPSEVAAEQIKQAHLVTKYEIQVAADIELLRASTMRAQRLARRGMADLSDKERAELAGMYSTLVQGIDATLDDLYGGVASVAGADVSRPRLLDDTRIQDALMQIEDGILRDQLPAPRAATDDETIIAQRLRVRAGKDRR